MSNKITNHEKILQLVIECRTSGLSDRQWCINHDINPSTFYYWVQKLRNQACYEIPESSSRNSDKVPACVVKQEVVRVEIIPDEQNFIPPSTTAMSQTPIVVQYQDASIQLPDDFNPAALKNVLICLKEALC